MKEKPDVQPDSANTADPTSNQTESKSNPTHPDDSPYLPFEPYPGNPYPPHDPRHYVSGPEDILPEDPEPPNWFDDDDDYDTVGDERDLVNPHSDTPDTVPFTHQSQNGFSSPFYQWARKLAVNERPEETRELSEQAFRELQVEKGQPFRKALMDEKDIGLPAARTKGPLMLHDSFDPAENPIPHAHPDPGFTRRAYTSDTPASEILKDMAQDMVEVGAVMIARMRVGLGYEPDAKMIRLYKDMALSLYKMHHIIKTNQPKRPRGRPRKNLSGK